MVTKAHNRMIQGSMVNVQDFGAVLDGSTDDSAAWALAEAAATLTGGAIYIPATAGGMAVNSGVSTVNSVVFEPGAFLLYTGSAEEAALTLGEVASNVIFKTFDNLQIRRNIQADWTNENNIGLRCINLNDCQVNVVEISGSDVVGNQGFTVGMQCEGNDLGYAHNRHTLGIISSAKIQLKLLTAETSLTEGWCNENLFISGRFGVWTGRNSGLARWGIKLTSTRATPSQPNSNLFLKPSFEMNAADASSPAIPILVEYGLENLFLHCRDEGNDSPFMECQNEAASNRATTTTKLTGVVLNSGDYADNFVEPARAHQFNRQSSSWQSPTLHRVANEYDGAGKVYVPGCSQRTSSNGWQWQALSSITVADEYLDIASSRGVGVMVETENIKRFVFRRDVVSGRGGRIRVIPYDTSGTQLTTDSDYVKGTASGGIFHTTDSGGSYITGVDDDGDFFFSVSSAVFFVWVGYFGGSLTAQVKSFGLESIDGGALTVFQGHEDANTDPYPNDYQNYATAVPATANAGPNYPAGKRLTKFNAVAGAEPGWICTTKGLGGTAVFKAEASVAA